MKYIPIYKPKTKLNKMKRQLTDLEDALLGFALFIIMFGGFYIFLLTYLSK